MQAVEMIGVDRLVNAAPPNVAGGGGLVDDELVVGRIGRCADPSRRTNAPPAPTRPSPRTTAASYKLDSTRFQWAAATPGETVVVDPKVG